jgi:hypothetical protein
MGSGFPLFSQVNVTELSSATFTSPGPLVISGFKAEIFLHITG